MAPQRTPDQNGLKRQAELYGYGGETHEVEQHSKLRIRKRKEKKRKEEIGNITGRTEIGKTLAIGNEISQQSERKSNRKSVARDNKWIVKLEMVLISKRKQGRVKKHNSTSERKRKTNTSKWNRLNDQ